MKHNKDPVPQFTEKEIQAITQALIDSFVDPRNQLIDTLAPCALKIDSFRNNLKTNNTPPQAVLMYCFEQFQSCAKVFGQFFNYHHKGAGREICADLLHKTKQLFDKVVVKQVFIDETGKQQMNIGLLLRKFPIEQTELFDTIKNLHAKARTELREKDINLYKLFSRYTHQILKLISIYANLVELKLVPISCVTAARQPQNSPSLFQRVMSFFPQAQTQAIATPRIQNDTAELLDKQNPTKIETIRC